MHNPINETSNSVYLVKNIEWGGVAWGSFRNILANPDFSLAIEIVYRIGFLNNAERFTYFGWNQCSWMLFLCFDLFLFILTAAVGFYFFHSAGRAGGFFRLPDTPAYQSVHAIMNMNGCAYSCDSVDK